MRSCGAEIWGKIGFSPGARPGGGPPEFKSEKKKKGPCLQHGKKRSQVDFIEIIDIFSAARREAKSSRISKNFRSFLRSMV